MIESGDGEGERDGIRLLDGDLLRGACKLGGGGVEVGLGGLLFDFSSGKRNCKFEALYSHYS